MNFPGKKQPKRTTKSAKDFKVVYISTPMKVKTSASKFRSLVQKLTGQYSDAESFIEFIAASTAVDRKNLHSSAFLDCQLIGDDDLTDCDHRLVAGRTQTAAYQSSVTPPDDLVLPNFDASFADFFDGFFT